MVLEMRCEKLCLKGRCHFCWMFVSSCCMVRSNILQQVARTVVICSISEFSEKKLRLFYNRGKRYTLYISCDMHINVQCLLHIFFFVGAINVNYCVPLLLRLLDSLENSCIESLLFGASSSNQRV